MNHRRLLACLAVACLVGVACGPPVRPDGDTGGDVSWPDACVNCPDGTVGDGAFDGISPDGDPGDGTSGDGNPGDGSSDGPPGDAPPGACMPAAATHKLANERRILARVVHVRAAGSGFVAGTRAQRGGVENAWIARVGADGMVAGETNASDLVGPSVSGAGHAPAGVDHAVVFSSNADGSDDIFVRRVGSDGTAMGTPSRVSNDMPASTEPQIVASGSGWIAVWRSHDDMAGVVTLLAAAISSSLTASAPVAAIPMGEVPGSWQLVSDGSRVLLAYVRNETRTADLFVASLGATGAPTGAPVRITMGAQITDAVGIAIRGDTYAVTWGDRGTMATLHARTGNAGSGMLGPVVDYSALGLDVSKPGIGVDGMSWVLGFRRAGSPVGSVAMMRLDAMLAPREGASEVDAATTGDAVRIAARGDGTYAVGWADDFPSGTVANVRVMRCR